MRTNYFRIAFFSMFLMAFLLMASEVYFVVTNSNRGEFYAEGEPQNMSSGLYSSYIHSDNLDYRKIKAKGGLLVDFDLDGDLDIFEQMGGFYLSDGFTNILYQNSNNINNWIGIKLIGVKSNKIALGAKINLVCDNKNYNSIINQHK